MKANKILGFIPFVIVILLFIFVNGCKTEELPPPTMKITATNDSVTYLTGTSIIHWECLGATKCTQLTRWGYYYVNLEGYIKLSSLQADTTLSFTCIGTGGTTSNSITIKVKEKSQYYKNIDILCTGRWRQTDWLQKTSIGWVSAFSADNAFEYSFSKNYDYSELYYIYKYDHLTKEIPSAFHLDQDGKVIKLGLNSYISQIRTLTNDSLVLYYIADWVDQYGNSGTVPALTKYIHLLD